MHSMKAGLGIALLMVVSSAACGADFTGAGALNYTRRLVALGPRPSGSAAHKKMQALIKAELAKLKCQVIEDKFTASTPAGPIAMNNIIARFPGTSGTAVAVTGHYDTKVFAGFPFVGANDGGASAGFLLELAKAASGKPRRNELLLVWFDGEEAVKDWSDTDGVYGSRHLAGKWSSDGTLRRLKALINVDMIGDRDLLILSDFNSSNDLRAMVWRTARELGYGRHFSDMGTGIEDDHMPFIRKGVKAVDLIDFDYGPNNSYWHTAQDTMDKLNANSFWVVGHVVTETLRRLEQ
jgi:glutaminyl-peptide cyclotransferase